jgi:hypothetical protein
MQSIQLYPSHPAHIFGATHSPEARGREVYQTPDKKTTAQNYSPGKKSMNYSGDSYNNTKISSFMSRRLFM